VKLRREIFERHIDLELERKRVEDWDYDRMFEDEAKHYRAEVKKRQEDELRMAREARFLGRVRSPQAGSPSSDSRSGRSPRVAALASMVYSMRTRSMKSPISKLDNSAAVCLPVDDVPVWLPTPRTLPDTSTFSIAANQMRSSLVKRNSIELSDAANLPPESARTADARRTSVRGPLLPALAA